MEYMYLLNSMHFKHNGERDKCPHKGKLMSSMNSCQLINPSANELVKYIMYINVIQGTSEA